MDGFITGIGNEASWGGDKAAEGVFKAAVTESFVLINQKKMLDVDRLVTTPLQQKACLRS